MAPLKLSDVTDYVDQNIGTFHAARLDSLNRLALKEILKRKNPYLFRAKFVTSAPQLVQSLLDAHLSSQEEAMFGTFLERLVVFVCGRVYGGDKSGAEGIDIQFRRDGITYIVAIKSGPNWGNSSQIARMKDNFKRAAKILRTNSRHSKIEAVNGCCYGIDNRPEKDGYLKLCGQRFWEFVSNNPQLYIDIVEPLGHEAKERNEEFLTAYGALITKFTVQFAGDFCDPTGAIDWGKLVRFNSQATAERR